MRALLLSAVLLATPAMAEDKLRDFCGDRPGLGTPACTVDKGHLQAEVGLGDWQLDKQPDSRTDTVTLGAISLRYGIGPGTELRLGWSGYGHVRTRDRMTGDVDRVRGAGDMTVGVKQNLSHPGGSGFSLAVLPYATLPTGKDQIGAGDWGAGVLIPVGYQLSQTISLELTPEFDAAVNGDGHGRHFAYGSVAGVQAKVGKKATVSAEIEAIRDRDPGAHSTQTMAALSLAYQASDNLQLDCGGIAGLNHKTPDLELSFGISERF